MAERSLTWIEREARKADASRDRVVLENPETVRELDAILRDTFHPAILKVADDAGYVLHPRGPDLDLRSDGRSRLRENAQVHALRPPRLPVLSRRVEHLPR